MTWNEAVCVSRRPVIVTVYVSAAIPVVWMVTVTVPVASGPLTASGCGRPGSGEGSVSGPDVDDAGGRAARSDRRQSRVQRAQIGTA
jgi:hypothetical protein